MFPSYIGPVSYTHLDVYKRQPADTTSTGITYAQPRLLVFNLFLQNNDYYSRPTSSTSSEDVYDSR